jgi:hypothetical protein
MGWHRFFSKKDPLMEWWMDRMLLQGWPAKDDKVLARIKFWSKTGPNPDITDRVLLLRTGKNLKNFYLRKCYRITHEARHIEVF